MKLRIVHITPYYQPAVVYGGPVVSVSRLAEAQTHLGNVVMVLTTNVNGGSYLPTGFYTHNGVAVRRFANIGLRFVGTSFGLLGFLWRNIAQFDLIHIHTWWNLTAVGAVCICALRRKRAVLSVRGMLSQYSFTNHNALAKKLLFTCMRGLLQKLLLHATAPSEAAELRQLMPRASVCMLPNLIGFETPNSIPPPHVTQKRQLVFLSRIDPKKGLEDLFAALVELPDIHLTLAGIGDTHYVAQLKQLAESVGISNRIKWVGWLDEQTKFTFLQHAEALVLPSFNENFAVAVLEALSVGTAVVITEGVGLAYYVRKHCFGEVCAKNSQAIAHAVSVLLSDTQRLQAIRRLAPAQVAADFAAATLAQQYIAAWQDNVHA